MAITFTQSRNATATTVLSLSLAFNSNVSSGNPGLIVGVRDGFSAGDSANITVNDNVNAGNYGLDVTGNLATDGDTAAIFSLPNAAAGATTVKTTIASGTTTISMAIHEIAGLVTSAMLDKTAVTNSTSTAPNSGNTAATTQPSELVFGFLALDNVNVETITAGGGATLRENDSGRIASSTLVVSSTGVQSASFSLSVSEEWVCLCVTYIGATTAGTTSTNLGASWHPGQSPGLGGIDSARFSPSNWWPYTFVPPSSFDPALMAAMEKMGNDPIVLPPQVVASGMTPPNNTPT